MADELVGDYLRPFKYVNESRWASTGLVFELWVNHRERAAVVIWAVPGGVQHRADFGPGDRVVLAANLGAPYATNGAWLTLLADMHKAFRLAFPAEGACYPDALIRAFDQVAEWYRDLAHNPSFEE